MLLIWIVLTYCPKAFLLCANLSVGTEGGVGWLTVSAGVAFGPNRQTQKASIAAIAVAVAARVKAPE